MAELRRCAGTDFDAQAVGGLEAALADTTTHDRAGTSAVHG
jgi:hypothetical protein